MGQMATNKDPTNNSNMSTSGGAKIFFKGGQTVNFRNFGVFFAQKCGVI
jgi:hypothetical protein